MRKLRLYFHKSYLPENTPHTYMLYPFWGANPEHLESPKNVYALYETHGTDIFDSVPQDEADLLVAATVWEKNDESRRLICKLAEHATPDKPIVVFFWHDSDELVDLPNSVIFRTSMHNSTQKPNEFAMPTWSDDFTNGEITIRQKQSLPVVGFCGYAITRRANLEQYAKDVLRLFKDGLEETRAKRERRSYHILRARVLNRLKNSPLVNTNFLIRKKFYAHHINPKQSKLEYTDNMLNSDYMVCVRGAGNYSYRLYETLASGRIPVFVNTDCVLPYDFIVDWSHYFVWVDVREVDQIAEKVSEFHNRLSPDEFVELQKRCRQLWEEYLSPYGFFKNFYRHFQ